MHAALLQARSPCSAADAPMLHRAWAMAGRRRRARASEEADATAACLPAAHRRMMEEQHASRVFTQARWPADLVQLENGPDG